MKNSNQLGSATVFIYPSKDRYIGVCLELDLVDEDKNRDVLNERMKKRVNSYIAYIHKKNYDDTLLNRPAPKKYWNKFYEYLDLMREEEKKRMRDFQKFTTYKPVNTKTKDFVVTRESLAGELA